MSSQIESKTEISANHQAFQEISSNIKASSCGLLARGVGFEPTRPLRATDLAGLPPTRLGQPRPVLSDSSGLLLLFLICLVELWEGLFLSFLAYGLRFCVKFRPLSSRAPLVQEKNSSKPEQVEVKNSQHSKREVDKFQIRTMGLRP